MTLRIGGVAGIPIYIHPSWFIVYIILSCAIGPGYLRAIDDNLSFAGSLMFGSVVSAALFACLLLHEMAHGIFSRIYGLRVDGITLFLFGGVIDLRDEPRDWKQEFVIASAGPAASVVASAVFLLLWMVYQAVPVVSPACFYLALANIVLAAANLLPGLPLDGGRILRALIWAVSHKRKLATAISTMAGRIIGILLAVGGIGMAFASDWSGLWLAVMGWFVFDSAGKAFEYEHEAGFGELAIEGAGSSGG